MDNKNKEDMFFDDCPICRAMKAAQDQGRELSMEELKAAFQKAKDEGGVVGGEWHLPKVVRVFGRNHSGPVFKN
ncbi:MAG: hypothetical protein L7H18_05580 [Candidatus Nealsonbacteria bacterium DGGOD1a]|jgi:hypothetical protein|nr:MAG: hypothetical protein L7H18_05580 [Candidatus Nealsonbacteria bacterium DGGOD1a]